MDFRETPPRLQGAKSVFLAYKKWLLMGGAVVAVLVAGAFVGPFGFLGDAISRGFTVEPNTEISTYQKLVLPPFRKEVLQDAHFKELELGAVIIPCWDQEPPSCPNPGRPEPFLPF